MVRDPRGPYKHGRSTPKEGWLLKVKRFVDAEAVVIGVVEQEHNVNEATRDALGRAKRSSAKAGKRKTGMLGALLVRDVKTGVEFAIGSGFDEAARRELWLTHVVGRLVKYKSQPSGAKVAPRFPVFLGFRDEGDL
jgi:DNA ligase-1